MAFRFNLALLAAVLLNGAVLGDDSASSGAPAGADGERNAPSRGGDAGRKSGGRTRNGDKLVVLDSARATPSETVRKSASVMKRMSGQSSLSNRNEARNDHVGVGSKLHDQPATSHKAQASADDRHGMKLPHARRPAASRHGEGGLTSTSPKESAEVVDRKKEFENMVSGIIAEEAQVQEYDYSYPKGGYGECPDYPNGKCSSPYDSAQPGYGVPPDVSDQSGAGVLPGTGSSVSNASASGPQLSSTARVVSGSDSEQNSATENKDKDHTNDDKATKDVQVREKEKEEDGKEKGEEQLNEQKSNENSDGRETNNSSEDTENKTAPSAGNSAFLSGSSSSVLLVALVCLCACAC
ncbi:hypothetical protein ERJ75_001109400 [Trypanosoma vivax]|nr:hypothetical protein ERJ75_001109400 [Trypanosoma vivax]